MELKEFIKEAIADITSVVVEQKKDFIDFSCSNFSKSIFF